jgi:RimJ/RimL family protein N-acetyltransferase
MENLKSNRLLLRKFEKTDTLALFEYLSDSEVLKYEPINHFHWNKQQKKH